MIIFQDISSAPGSLARQARLGEKDFGSSHPLVIPFSCYP